MKVVLKDRGKGISTDLQENYPQIYKKICTREIHLLDLVSPLVQCITMYSNLYEVFWEYRGFILHFSLPTLQYWCQVKTQVWINKT